MIDVRSVFLVLVVLDIGSNLFMSNPQQLPVNQQSQEQSSKPQPQDIDPENIVKPDQAYQEQEKNSNDFDDTDIPYEKPTNKKLKHVTVLMKYCTSSGYQKNFEQIREALYSHFGFQKVTIFGEEDHPSAQTALLGKLLTYVQYGFLILVVAGDKIFSYLQRPYPTWYLKIRDSKLQAGIAIYFLGNMLIQSLKTTGGFEVFINDDLIFSKLNSGQLPDTYTIIKQIENII